MTQLHCLNERFAELVIPFSVLGRRKSFLTKGLIEERISESLSNSRIGGNAVVEYANATTEVARHQYPFQPHN
jgi:hypothetical protein